jgi:ParB family chromosome partitioning protein
MGNTALNERRRDMFLVSPEKLTLVADKNNPLYDPRVEDAPGESMIANIAMHGVLEPIIVRKNGQNIEVVAGRGRTKAAMEVNRRLTAEGKSPLLVPVLVKGGTDADLFGVMISENEIRRGDALLVKGAKARKLLHLGYTVQQIAVTFGVSRQAVDQWLAAEELPEPNKQAVEAGEIKASAALQMARHAREEQVQRFEDIKKNGIKPTVHTMRSAAEAADNQPAPKMKTRKEILHKMNAVAAEGDEEWRRAYVSALLWVLGKEE